MSETRRVFLLIVIMTAVSVVFGIVSIAMLYQAAFREEEARLGEMAASQARMIEAIARFGKEHDPDYPKAAEEAVLSQVIDAHGRYRSASKTGEFTLAKREGNEMVFLVSHRRGHLQERESIAFVSELAEPMRRALSGLSGTLVGPDYRGVTVLAAHEPVAELGLGIVSKIDLAEIRAPFIRAGITSGLIGMAAVLMGTLLFLRTTDPLIRRLHSNVQELQSALDKVKLLSGFLPICASCKKIRDDQGYWNNLEVYISQHSEAEFSHGICPECVKRLYPEYSPKEEESGARST
jgi:hypothetical protein